MALPTMRQKVEEPPKSLGEMRITHSVTRLTRASSSNRLKQYKYAINEEKLGGEYIASEPQRKV